MGRQLSNLYNKWPGVVCVNCGDEIRGVTSHPEILHFTLAGVYEAFCFGCGQDYIVLTNTQGQYLAHYTSFLREVYTWPCERVAKRSGVLRKNISQIRKEHVSRSRKVAGQKNMF